MLEQAAAVSPDDANIPFYQGFAHARLNEPEKAIQAFSKSVEMQPTPYRWNEVAYVMASEKLNLPQAEKYARSAIDAVALLMRDASLQHINKGYVSRTQQLAMCWDTLGRVLFQEGDLGSGKLRK